MILGDHIYVIITANNLYGASLESVPGDGAAIVFLPEAPLNLANNAAITSAVQIGLTWSEGISDGGKEVEDYRIWYDSGTNTYTELVTVTDTFYTAESLTPGNTYKFKVQSRNSVGYSPFSNEVSILAAQVPSTPEAPLTILSGTSVIISWLVPYNGGSTITSYTITIRESDGVTFSEDATSCDGSDPTIMAQKRCVVSFDVFRGEQFNLPWGSSI
jgi:hypothetical protein